MIFITLFIILIINYNCPYSFFYDLLIWHHPGCFLHWAAESALRLFWILHAFQTFHTCQFRLRFRTYLRFFLTLSVVVLFVKTFLFQETLLVLLHIFLILIISFNFFHFFHFLHFNFHLLLLILLAILLFLFLTHLFIFLLMLNNHIYIGNHFFHALIFFIFIALLIMSDSLLLTVNFFLSTLLYALKLLSDLWILESLCICSQTAVISTGLAKCSTRIVNIQCSTSNFICGHLYFIFIWVKWIVFVQAEFAFLFRVVPDFLIEKILFEPLRFSMNNCLIGLNMHILIIFEIFNDRLVMTLKF